MARGFISSAEIKQRALRGRNEERLDILKERAKIAMAKVIQRRAEAEIAKAKAEAAKERRLMAEIRASRAESRDLAQLQREVYALDRQPSTVQTPPPVEPTQDLEPTEEQLNEMFGPGTED